MIIATVTKIEGNVFVKKIDGTISKLAEGDKIDSGDIVFGADEKSAYTIVYADNSGVMTFAGATPQLFDPTMIPAGADGAEGAVEIASANPFAHSILTKEEIAALISGEVLKGDENVLEETSSGQEKVKESEASGDTFAARSGAITDVNSGLRNAKFVSSQAREDVQDVFKREDSARLETSAKNNEMPPPPPPPPPAPTPPPLPELPVTPPPLRGILSLSGDLTVPEGADASYTLSVTEAPRTPLIITIQIGHITTENGDLIPRFITVTIPAGQKTVSFPIFNNPDGIYEGSENYHVSIVSTSGGEYNELLIGDDTVVTTINDGQTPPTLTINDQTINEQEGTMTFTVSLSGITEADVTFEYASANTTATAAEDYSTVSGTKTIPAGLTSITITVPIHDDYISDNGETFQIILSNPSSNAVVGDGVGVGTILDDTGTPNTPSDGVEPTHESVIIKLVALDSTGNPILDGSGNYTFANDVNEGNSGHYMALAFTPNETTFAPTTVLANQTGTVNVTFANGSATGAATQTTQDGSQDYNNAPQVAVTLGTVISTATFDDYLSDNNQTFTIAMTNDSYLPATGGYENVTIDTAPVTTTIKDGVNDGIPNQPIDTVYVQLATNDTIAEQANGTLTHELKLVDKDGNAVNLASGETLTVALTYTGDTTEAGDFSTKQTSVIITGNGGSTYSFDNTIVEDFFLEGNESYTVAIASITNEGSYFENVEIDVAHNSATGTITDGANDQVPNQPVDTVYVQLITDDTTREGGTLSHTIKLVDSHGIAITVPAGETITVNITYVNGVGLNTSEYAASTPIQIVGGTSFTTVTNLTNADALIESTESYTATISTVTQANGTYENIAPYTVVNGADANAISVIGSITDGVDALPDAATVVEGSNTITHATFGNLLANDEIGVAGTITAFTYKDETGTTQTGTLGTAVDTQYGTLTLNANGTWTYISDPKETHGTILDTIRYTLTDGSTSSEADFVITVTDTTPTAVADTNAVAEDTASVSGNVFGAIGASANDHADTIGADTTATPVSGVRATAGDTTTEAVGSVASAVAGTYGSVNIAAGGGYTYTLNTTDVRVQHLANGETLTDSFVYTITDSDGDTSTTTLVITINGTDDVPAIAPVDGNGAITGQATVYEAGLASGSTPSATTETTNGTITLSAKDGLTSVTIGGTIITQATLLTSGSTTPVTINTVEGTLVINGFTPTDATHQDGSGTINYTYTLNAQQAHTVVQGNNELTDTIALIVTDRDLDTANGTLTVTIIDDVPTAVIETELSGLVEGALTAATSDGSDAAHANLLTNDAVSADTTIYINQITYLNESSVSTNAAITNGGSTTVDTINGSLTVYSDGRWSFTPDGSVANPLNADATDTFTYRIVDADGDTSSATKTFSIADGANPTIAPASLTVSETTLGTGAALAPFTVTGTALNVVQGSDSIANTKFTDATITDLGAMGIKSGGADLFYTLSADKHTITATKTNGSGAEVFVVSITTPASANAQYDFKLTLPLDHTKNSDPLLDHDTSWVLPFNVYTVDSDDNGIVDNNDDASGSFTVTVEDSTPTNVNQNVSLVEDIVGGKVIRLSQDAFNGNITLNNGHDGDQSVATNGSINIYDGASIIGTLTNMGDGTVKFIPLGNYSNYNLLSSSFTYTLTDNDGDTATATITLSVTPVADAPTMQTDRTVSTNEDNSWSGSAHNGDKLNPVSLGLILPTKADQVDLNGVTGDNPERLGLLTFTFSNSVTFGTATIVYDTNGDGSLDGILQTIVKNQSFTIDIPGISYTGASGTYSLTQAQYESLAIIPAEDNAGNILFTIKTASHEVTDTGALIGTGDIVSAIKTQNVTVNVLAITDPVSLTFDSDGTEADSNNKTYTFTALSEGINVINLDAILTATSGDTDGSENRWYTISGIPTGTVVTVGTSSGTADASLGGGLGAVTIQFPSNTDIDPAFTMTFPEQFSGTVSGTITLKATDTAQGSATTSIINETDSVAFNIVVAPVADITTLAVTQAQGYEDTPIALAIRPTSVDSSETFTITIADIPSGSEMKYDGVILDSSSGSVTIAAFDSTKTLTIKPPLNSNEDFNLQVTAHSVDAGQTGASSSTLALSVDVIGVADSVTISTSTAGTNEATIDNAGHKVALTTALVSAGLTDTDGSETLSVILTHLASEFSVEGAAFMGGSGTDRKWVFPSGDLSSVFITTPANYSGTIDLQAYAVTTENDGNSLKGSAIDLSIAIIPSTEATVNLSTTADEDALVNVSFAIAHQNGDTDETLDAVWIKESDVTGKEFTLYYGNNNTIPLANGQAGVLLEGGYYKLTGAAISNIYVQNSADKNGSYTFNIKTIISDVSSDNTTGTTTTTSANTIYTLTVSAVTDPITIAAAVTDTADIDIAGNIVTLLGTRTTIDVPLTISQVNNNLTAENGSIANGVDIDGSETLLRLVIDGVPDGVSVVGGTYIGDTGTNTNTGQWFVTLNQDFNAVSLTPAVQLVVDGSAVQLNAITNKTITITAYSQDDGAGALSAVTTIVLDRGATPIFTDTSYIVGTPVDVSTPGAFDPQVLTMTEDTASTLNTLITTDVTTAGTFSITLSDVPAGTIITGMTSTTVAGQTFYYATGTSLSTLLSSITVQAPQESNSNVVSNLTFKATVTSTSTGATESVQTVNISAPVTPVSDATTISITAGGVQEDNEQAIVITMSNPADTSRTTIIDGKLYLSVDDGAMMDGVLKQGVTSLSTESITGIMGVPDGAYYVINGVEYNSILNLTYTPASNASGSVALHAYLNSQETNASNIITSDTVKTFVVTPVTDGMNPTISISASGNEDEKIALVLSGTLLDDTDGSENLYSVTLSNVPNGYLVYIGGTTLAINAGSDGLGNNTWSIPLSSGALPAISILPPPNVSGTIAGITLSVYSGESTSLMIETSKTFDLVIAPVSDSVTIYPTQTFGTQYTTGVALNLNASARDLDGSETATIILVAALGSSALSANAWFMNGASAVTADYSAGTSTWTLHNVATADLGNIMIYHPAYTGTVDVSVQMQDGSATASPAATGSFIMTISSTTTIDTTALGTHDDNIIGTSGADTISTGAGNDTINGGLGNDVINSGDGDDQITLNIGDTVNGGTGIDTLIFTDTNINFSGITNITNIEKIDLTAAANQTISGLSLDKIFTMTDSSSSHTLTIDGNTGGDAVGLIDQAGWTSTGSTAPTGYTEYHYTRTSDSVTVTLKVETDLANTTGLA